MKKIEQTWVILEALGIPLAGLTARRKERIAKVFLAVGGLTPSMQWNEIQDNDTPRQMLSREIIAFVNAHWGEKIADSSYDDIRRKDLVLPVEALIILKSAKNPHANTNDGTRGFAINPKAAAVIRTFGTAQWDAAIAAFLQGRTTLAQELAQTRNLARVAVQIDNGVSLTFSAGKHNELQKQIIENFLAIFGHSAEVLYVGDTENKNLFCNQAQLKKLQFFELVHDKLPDVIAYSASKNWLFLIEAVTTANPITELLLSGLESAYFEHHNRSPVAASF